MGDGGGDFNWGIIIVLPIFGLLVAALALGCWLVAHAVHFL